MDWLINNPSLVHLASFLGGIFIALVGNYLKFSSDISFIKGQLTEIMKGQERIDQLTEKYGKLEQDFASTALDLNKALNQIKYIEFEVLKHTKGEFYGSSS
jgi:hypothetical protein